MSSSQLRLACATAKSSSWEMWDRRAWRTRASGSLKELMWMAHLTSAHVPEFRQGHTWLQGRLESVVSSWEASLFQLKLSLA